MQNNNKTKEQLLKEIDQLRFESVERNKTVKTLLEKEQFMTSIFESVQEGICILNTDLTIRHVNGLMNKWYKKNTPLIGKKCYEVYHNADTPCTPCPSLRCLESGNPESNVIPGLPVSSIKWVELFSYPLKDLNTNKVVGIVEYVRDVTEREESREKLKKSEEKFKVLFESAPDPYFILDLKGNLIDGNSAAEKFIGYKKKELIGKNILKTGLMLRPQIPKAIARLFTYAGGKTQGPIDFSVVKKDKSTAEIELLSSFITLDNKKFILSIARDITQEKQAKKLLLASEKKYRDLFEKSEDSILIIRDRKFIDCNKATVKMFGFNSKKEMLNTHPSELSPEFQPDGKNSFDKANEILDTISKKGSKRFEWEHSKSNGETFPVEVLLTAVFFDNNQKIIHTVLRDISVRKKAEKELIMNHNHLEKLIKERTLELEKSNEKLIEKNEKLIHFNELFIGREFRINELRNKVKKMEKEAGSRRSNV